MKEYLDLVSLCLKEGEDKHDRTNTGTLSVFGPRLVFDIRNGFPLVTTKKIIFESVVRELLWFISGSTNVKDLHPCKIWDPWADENGDLGPVYSHQWRKWEAYFEKTHNICSCEVKKDNDIGYYKKMYIDQLFRVIQDIKVNPHSRRLIVNSWNVSDLHKMALPPCHCLYQFNVANGFLDLQLYQRSADLAVGVPFNIASYALLLMMVANECDLTPRHFIHTFGDLHIYKNHIEGLNEQLTRKPYSSPKITIADKSLFDMKVEDIVLSDYNHHPFIKFEIAV